MIDQGQIIGLAAERGFPRVSLFLATPRGVPDRRQGPVQLGNLLRDAGRLLRERGADSRVADDLIARISRETGDAFWQRAEDGLAIFASPDAVTIVRALVAFAPQVHVGEQFVVRPLLPLLMRDGTFFVLAASTDRVALWRGTRFGMEPVEDDRIPASAAVVTGPAEIENATGFHAASRGAAAIRVHALGESPADEAEDLIDEFARRTAKAVETVLSGHVAPLVLAADDRMLGKLRRSLDRVDLVEEGIREHPSSMDEATLHDRAYALVRDRLDTDRRALVERLEGRLATGSGASDRIDQILTAATEGRVDTLVVAADPADPATLGWAPGQAPPPEEQLVQLDRAILETLSHGGRVLTRPVDRAEDFPAAAALYRY